MHVEDIFKEFKMRYPDHKYSDASQIKSFLYKHKHIKAIGKLHVMLLTIGREYTSEVFAICLSIYWKGLACLFISTIYTME